jgi:hypothetical protein
VNDVSSHQLEFFHPRSTNNGQIVRTAVLSVFALRHLWRTVGGALSVRHPIALLNPPLTLMKTFRVATTAAQRKEWRMPSSASSVSSLVTTRVLHPLNLVQIRAQCFYANFQRNSVNALIVFTVSNMHDSRLGGL